MIPVDEGPVEEGEISEARDHAPEELATAEFVVPSYSPGMISEFHFIVFLYACLLIHVLPCTALSDVTHVTESPLTGDDEPISEPQEAVMPGDEEGEIPEASDRAPEESAGVEFVDLSDSPGITLNFTLLLSLGLLTHSRPLCTVLPDVTHVTESPLMGDDEPMSERQDEEGEISEAPLFALHRGK